MGESLPIRRGVAAAGRSDPLTVMGALVLIIAVLYVGREIFIPIALAVLLSFVLAPLVRVLRRGHLPRGLSVAASVLVAFSLIGALAWLMAAQVTDLASDLPRYQETMRSKIVSLKGAAGASTAMESASDVLDRLSEEIARPEPEEIPEIGTEPEPVPVVVTEPPPEPLETLAALVEPLLHPFATTGIVIIFVVFILLQREDLRNRLIKLVGTGDLQKTTEALDDAAMRLSRLLLTQLGLNTAYGVVIGIGLTLIGVPSAALWGILAGILRFVPYIGAIIGSALPIILAAAVDPGWGMLVQAALLFLIIEPIVGHFIEPMVFGRSTGLSPVAVVVAATFWTWLWGPVGLVLATPMTVCLVVLGRHVKGLAFIEVILGDRPVLSPEQLFYQRALAGDAAEIVSVAEEILKERSLSEYFDGIALPALRLAQSDVDRGVLGANRLPRLRDTVEEVVEDLEAYEDVTPPSDRETTDSEAEAAVDRVPDDPEMPVLAAEALDPDWRSGVPVLCLAADGPLDEAAAHILTRLVSKHGIGARAETSDLVSARRIVELDGRMPQLVCVCHLSSTPLQIRHMVRRLRRRLPRAELLVCHFVGGIEVQGLVARQTVGLRPAVAAAIEAARGGTDAEEPSPVVQDRDDSSRPVPARLEAGG